MLWKYDHHSQTRQLPKNIVTKRQKNCKKVWENCSKCHIGLMYSQQFCRSNSFSRIHFDTLGAPIGHFSTLFQNVHGSRFETVRGTSSKILVRIQTAILSCKSFRYILLRHTHHYHHQFMVVSTHRVSPSIKEWVQPLPRTYNSVPYLLVHNKVRKLPPPRSCDRGKINHKYILIHLKLTNAILI